MNGVNKTLYIPLYGKSYVSKKGLFINDKKAEYIWDHEGFELKGKAKSKWLAYYMGIRAAIFDDWLREQIKKMSDAVVIHIGCGLDSRALRLGNVERMWYDIDITEVINERKKYYSETESYKMIACDVRSHEWIDPIDSREAIVVIEGVSMYLAPEESKKLAELLDKQFDKISLLLDCYTDLGAKLSKHRNPINEVGVSEVYGAESPSFFESENLQYIKEHDMTPKKYINELRGVERAIFKGLYAGKLSKSLYKMFEYKK